MRPISFDAGATTAIPALATMFDAQVSWRASAVKQKLITVPVLPIGAAGPGGDQQCPAFPRNDEHCHGLAAHRARLGGSTKGDVWTGGSLATAEPVGPPHPRVGTGDKAAASYFHDIANAPFFMCHGRCSRRMFSRAAIA
jgi:hypothetical protein